jgi:hypothetical protein
MNIYSTNITIVATVFVRAEDEKQAKELIRLLDGEHLAFADSQDVGLDTEIEISAAQMEDLPDVSLSPAMTIRVTENQIAAIELADEGEDDEEETE